MIEIIISTITGAITYFIAGWIAFELILGKFMLSNMTNIPGFLRKMKSLVFYGFSVLVLPIHCYSQFFL